MASPTNASITEGPARAHRVGPATGAQRTFLFTDVEGSTRLWEQYPESMRAALERHDELLREAITRESGDVVKTTGDGLMAVFPAPVGAVSAGIAAQRSLLAEPWPETCSIRVRMGIHTGLADERGGDFFGPAVNRTARVMAAGHGGQILVSGSTATLVGEQLAAPARLRDLGEHRLKDLERPERLFQVTHPDLAAEFPPLSTLDLRPNNLPTQTSPFVGRDRELRAVRERLDDPAVRLLTLTGPGGTGKTRLALRAAADQIDRFEDGVFFVDLASAADGDAALALIAQALRLPDTKERSIVDDLRRQLAPKQVLLVLDTFEHITSAAPLLVETLADGPGVKLLVTSREALRVRGENVVSIPPLALPAAARSASVEELSQFEAIQLFVERARAVRSDFGLTDDNAAAVAEICRRLDGLPLAIELATARMNLFTPEALRDRLGSRLKALGSGARDLPARQQTLRATIEWSYQLLEPPEQRLFELLSVFATTSLEAIEAVAERVESVAGVELDAVEGLGSLLDKSLVRQVASNGGDAAGRIAMLETIREYATERLEANPTFAAAGRDAHARHFTELASTAWRAATTTEGEPDITALQAVLDDLRIAWRHWVERDDLEQLDRLVDPLWQLSEARGWYHLTIELINDLLRVLRKRPPSDDRWKREVTLQTSLARALTMLRGYTGEVEDAYARALELFDGRPQVPQVYPVLRSLASFHGFRSEMDKGIEYVNAIVRLADAQGDSSMRIDGEILLGSYTGFLGRLQAAVDLLDEAITSFERGGYRPRRLRLGIDARVSGLTTSGFFLWLLGYPDRAVTRADRSVELASQLDHPYSLAYAYYHSGFLHLWRREPELVKGRATSSLEVAENSDLPIWRALATCLLGAATSALGEPDEGVRLVTAGIDEYRGLRTPPIFWPLVRFTQASAYLDAGRRTEGLALIDEALAIGGDDDTVAPLLQIVRGDLCLLEPERDVDAAVAAYEAAFAQARGVDARMPQLRATVRLLRVAGEETDRAKRVETLRALYSTFSEGLATRDMIEAAELIG